MTNTLTMPRHFVVIENDEMEYLDGGANRNGVTAQYFLVSIFLDANRANTLAFYLQKAGAMARVGAVFSTVATQPIVTAVLGIMGGSAHMYGAQVARANSTRRGVVLRFTALKGVPIGKPAIASQ